MMHYRPQFSVAQVSQFACLRAYGRQVKAVQVIHAQNAAQKPSPFGRPLRRHDSDARAHGRTGGGAAAGGTGESRQGVGEIGKYTRAHISPVVKFSFLPSCVTQPAKLEHQPGRFKR